MSEVKPAATRARCETFYRLELLESAYGETVSCVALVGGGGSDDGQVRAQHALGAGGASGGACVKPVGDPVR